MKNYLLFLYIILNINLLSAQTSKIAASSTSSRRTSYFSNDKITYSEAETSDAYAFSYSFEKKYLKDIEMLVAQEYPGFKDNIYSKSESFEIKIKLKRDKLKLELKTFNRQVPEDLAKIKSIASKVKKLEK